MNTRLFETPAGSPPDGAAPAVRAVHVTSATPANRTTRASIRVDPAGCYQLHPSVAVRPEPFGALVYHYGNRKLVFLKSNRMVAVVRALASCPTVADALHVAGVAHSATDRYLDALSSLLASDMIQPVEPAVRSTSIPS